MSLLEQNILSHKDITNIQILQDYCEFTVPKLNNITLRGNDQYLTCMDINNIQDKEHFINMINILLINYGSTKNINNVINDIQYKLNNTNNEIKFDLKNDPLQLFGKKKIKTKYSLNRSSILKNFQMNDSKFIKNIPKELQLNYKQVFEMIYSEVDRINKNFDYDHYIVFKDNDPYTLCFRFRYNTGELYEKLNTLNDNFGFDYIEVIINLDSALYPFMPPSLEYSKPNMSSSVIYNMKNSNVFETTKWNSNISLEWLLNEFAKMYEPYFNKYIDITKEYPDISKIEKNIFDLFDLMGINKFDNFNIGFSIPSFNEIKHKKTYWGSGTGYGYEGTNTWDIQSFIKEQQDSKNKINEKLETIRESFKDCDNKENVRNTMGVFLTNQFKGTNLFDFNKNYDTYKIYVSIIADLQLHLNHINSEVIIYLYEEIKELLENETLEKELDESKKVTYTTFIILFTDTVKNYKQEKSQLVSDDIIENYNIMVKDNIFGTYTFYNKHLYYKYKDNKITNKKNLLRLIGEISSLKKNLPVNWDTSSILRVDKKYPNMIKFVITGPKDTPYHNGVYEFHAYFPASYPNDPPQVLLNTTDGGTVRFNPNLYANGKVCLSLLGTWSGQQGEKWNGDISTFLQVIISIQSLIMVEDPYFNEPGYEKSMHTTSGKAKAFDYKDERRYQNLRVSILNQLKNPPEGFEEFTINHFKYKKDEILETAKKWKDETKRYKTNIEEFMYQFIQLINK